MATQPWFRFDVSEWLGSTRIFLMSLKAQGVYITMLAQHWHMGNYLPADESQLCRVLYINKREWRSVRDEVLPLFQTVGDRLVNPELDKMWKQRQKRQKPTTASAPRA